MTQHFTTPEFAQVLKQNGIDIDTPFYWQPEVNPSFSGYYLMATDDMDKENTITLDWLAIEPINDHHFSAYPLTQVLGWLPETVKAMDGGVGRRNVYYNDNALLYCYTTICGWQSIEALIIQGLTEGWLNKDNLNLAK